MKYLIIALFSFCSTLHLSAAPPAARLVSVHKIWDQAPHSAFTDLVHWKGQFVCAFREGRAHVSTDGRIRVLTSADGETWTPTAVITLSGYDLRDAGLSITPDDRLMLNGGAAPRKNDHETAPTGTFISFSADAKTWSKPEIVLDPPNWLWRAIWHDGKCYGVSYADHLPSRLMVSDDGLKYSELVPKFLFASEARPTEATLLFAEDGTMYCLHRRDNVRASAYLGSSRPPYTDWQWHDLGVHVGGPNLIQLPSGKWLAAGRFFSDPKKPKTKLAALDMQKHTIEPILELPSGGDTSYPGLVWHEDQLWMSYYSSHEGKGKIYLAKISID
jgi:hypothetical protein